MTLNRAKEHDLTLNPLAFTRHPDRGILPLRLWKKQREFRDLVRRVRKVAGWDGPNRAGKSMAASVVIIELLTGLPYEAWATLDRLPDVPPGPPRYVGCITISKDKSRDGQQKYLAERIPAKWLASKGWHPKTGFGTSGPKLVLTNGSVVDFLSDLQRDVSLEAFAWHLLWIDEAVDEWVFHRGIARLADTGGKALITAVAEKAWIYRVLRQRRMSLESLEPLPADFVDTIADSTMMDNELMSAEKLDGTIQAWGGLDTREARMRVLGQYVHLEGVVFPEYSEGPGGHLGPPIDIAPQAWTKYEGADPGYALPFAWSFMGVDQAGWLHIYDEIYIRNKTPAEIAALVKAKRRQHNYTEPQQPTTIDSAADAAKYWGQARKPVSRQLLEAGIRTVPCLKYAGSVDAGEQVLRAWLKSGKVVVHANCEWTRHNLFNYRYADVPTGVGEFTGDRERKVDAHNHLIDAIRYRLEAGVQWAPLAARAAAPGSFADDLRKQALAKQAARRERW